MTEEIIELALCEQTHLILKPNVLYRFVVMEGCYQCEELARLGDPTPQSSVLSQPPVI
jgi:hypothetical protein